MFYNLLCHIIICALFSIMALLLNIIIRKELDKELEREKNKLES